MLPSTSTFSSSRLRTVVVLKDETTVAIFRHLCRALRAADPSLPDVHSNDDIAFLPKQNVRPEDWQAHGLSPSWPSLTLLERRDAGSRESDSIHDRLRAGDNAIVLVTSKATLFNYLSPRAIQEKLGVEVFVTDTSDVPLFTAQALHAAKHKGEVWDMLDRVTQARLVDDAARLLAAEVAPTLTSEMLVERRAKADVGRWLYALKFLLIR